MIYTIYFCYFLPVMDHGTSFIHFSGDLDDRLFPEKYTVKGHISNTKLEKGHHYYIQTRHKEFFPLKISF